MSITTPANGSPNNDQVSEADKYDYFSNCPIEIIERILKNLLVFNDTGTNRINILELKRSHQTAVANCAIWLKDFIYLSRTSKYWRKIVMIVFPKYTKRRELLLLLEAIRFSPDGSKVYFGIPRKREMHPNVGIHVDINRTYLDDDDTDSNKFRPKKIGFNNNMGINARLIATCVYFSDKEFEHKYSKSFCKKPTTRNIQEIYDRIAHYYQINFIFNIGNCKHLKEFGIIPPFDHNFANSLSKNYSLYGLYKLVRKIQGWFTDLHNIQYGEEIKVDPSKHIQISKQLKVLVVRSVNYYDYLINSIKEKLHYSVGHYFLSIVNVRSLETKKQTKKLSRIPKKHLRKTEDINDIYYKFKKLFEMCVTWKILTPITMRLGFLVLNIMMEKYIKCMECDSFTLRLLYNWFSSIQNNKLFMGNYPSLCNESLKIDYHNNVDARFSLTHKPNSVSNILHYLSVAWNMFDGVVPRANRVGFMNDLGKRIWHAGYNLKAARTEYLETASFVSGTTCKKLHEYQLNTTIYKLSESRNCQESDFKLNCKNYIANKKPTPPGKNKKGKKDSSSAQAPTVQLDMQKVINQMDPLDRFVYETTHTYRTLDDPNIYNLIKMLAKYYSMCLKYTFPKVNSVKRGGIKNSIKKARLQQGAKLMKKFNLPTSKKEQGYKFLHIIGKQVVDLSADDRFLLIYYLEWAMKKPVQRKDIKNLLLNAHYNSIRDNIEEMLSVIEFKFDTTEENDSLSDEDEKKVPSSLDNNNQGYNYEDHFSDYFSVYSDMNDYSDMYDYS